MRSLCWLLLVFTSLVMADPKVATPLVSAPQKLQAMVELHTADELQRLLTRAEQVANGDGQYRTEDPIAIVLHGQEIQLFKRSSYDTHKQLIDLAAKLDAFNVVDLKVCQRWMGDNGILADELPAFLEPVPFGGDEVQRLQEAGYAFF
ncbi:hypothetical protein CHH28_05830 [Bacterioplanes sanyensis]|uniref:Uncharacterized protein n=1 Tax=Bacterioplanes sanyensis TaxID=1249553 RepID=A0A222FII7_9GAMM|nr:DsrE family protein [Bacterioplanes sanyensis]ASP38231.1 hypothetical protein CHH28_05830 [Bacterioplanes sanyensis]